MTDRAHASEPAPRVAVVDRDSGFIQVLTKRMERLAWEHIVLASPVPPENLQSMRLSALVIDLATIGQNGWDYLDRVCHETPDVAVVVVTGQTSVAQRVRGLRMGADDWVTKPCHPEEVLARVEAVMRRRRRADALLAAEPVVAGEVAIRDDQYQAYIGRESADLTRREFELLQLLASADGRVLEREEIYRRVWGYSMARGDRSVDVFVRKVRAKLAKASPDWNYIHTHFGVGYRFAAEPREGTQAAAAAAEAEAASAPEPDPAAEPARRVAVPA